MPYIKDAHSKEFGGPRDYYNCTDRFYIITYKPTKADIKSVTGSKYPCLLISSTSSFYYTTLKFLIRNRSRGIQEGHRYFNA